jgi:hypothetical protein
MAAGLSIMGGLWVLSASAGSLVDHYELLIPVAGPFITAHDLDSHWDPSFGRTLVVGMLAMDGLFQTAGLIMAIAGGASRAPVKKKPAPIAPSFYPTMGGLSGRF